MNNLDSVRAFLEARAIPYMLFHHEPVSSIAECARVSEQVGAMVCKNYFLSTRNRKSFALCVVRPEARFHTADLSKQIGSSRLSFGHGEDLLALMRTLPGAVSPMGLIFDTEKRIRLLVDRALTEQDRLAFHPCDNRATLVLTTEDWFHRFLPAVGRKAEFVDIHDFSE